MKNKKSGFFIKIIGIQILVNVLILLDIPVFRQVVLFFYLSFLPGFLLLNILKLKLDKIESIVFSLGLSLAFLMIVGLLINELYPLIGILEPLSMSSLLTTLNFVMGVLSLISYFTDAGFKVPIMKDINLFSLLLLFLPVLSIFGAQLAAYQGDNSLLLILIVLVSGLMIFGTLYGVHRKSLPRGFYPLALLSITITLFFHLEFISLYLIGGDIRAEYTTFQFTEKNLKWIPGLFIEYYRGFSFQKANSMLSVTVLPMIYSQFLNLEGVQVFKIIFPLIFSIPISLGSYQLYRKQIGERFAFLATFFFISNFMIYEVLTLNKEMIAELFFILLIYLILENTIGSLKKVFLFTVFSIALVVSHYGTSYLFLFYLFFGWLFSYFKKYKRKNLKLSWVVLFFAMAFSWYVYVSSSASFVAVVSVGNNILNSIINDLFNPAARGRDVTKELGATAVSFGHEIGRLFYYATQFFIVVGFSISIIKRKKKEISQEYLIISSISLFILLLCIILPRFSASLNVTRIYHITLITLSPFCILGGETVFRYLTRLKSSFCISLLILTILIPYFLYNVGFVYEVTGDVPSSIPLSMHRMDKETLWNKGIIFEQDIFGCEWLSTYTFQIEEGQLKVYGDLYLLSTVFENYGSIPFQNMHVISDIENIQDGAYITIGLANEKQMWGPQWLKLNVSQIFSALDYKNKIYSNGGNEIYQRDSRP